MVFLAAGRAGPSTLKVLGNKHEVWVIKSSCGAQHAANILPVSVVSLCSLTERAQLLKNVFKKSTVSLYRSDSMQQNLLRKLNKISFFFFSHPFRQKSLNIVQPKRLCVRFIYFQTAPLSGEQLRHHFSSSDTNWISKSPRVSQPLSTQRGRNTVFISPLFINTLHWADAGNTHQYLCRQPHSSLSTSLQYT